MTHKHAEPVAPLDPMPPEEFDGMAFELGLDGKWRAYDEWGLIAVAPTFRELYEITGGRWN